MFYSSFAQTNTFPESGNVGIGTLTPGRLLELYSGARRFSVDGDGVVQWNQDGAGGTLTWDTNTAILGTNAATANLSLRPAGVNVMMLQSNGRVGIGTSNPGAIFGEMVSINGATNILNGNVLYFSNPGNTNGAGIRSTSVSSGGAADLNLFGGAGIGTGIFIQNEGNVGIGTTDTQGYKLAVNGNIRTKEVKVENTNWPDYVFTKEYQLPTLQQTEQHIKEKGHLPGIPSAEEVKAKGIDVGEMNAKLLQKIEELTLHLIQQDKNYKQLQEEVRSLKGQQLQIRDQK